MQEDRVVHAHSRQQEARQQMEEVDALAEKRNYAPNECDRKEGRKELDERAQPEEHNERDEHQRERKAALPSIRKSDICLEK